MRESVVLEALLSRLRQRSVCVSLLAVLTLGSEACVDKAAPPSDAPKFFRDIAASAKSEGQTARTFDVTGGDAPTDFTIDTLGQRYSFVLGTFTDALATTTTSRDIISWKVFSVRDVVVSNPRVEPSVCDLVPTRPIKSGEIAVPLFAGSIIVDGIRITEDSPDARVALRNGQQYLLILNRCTPEIAHAAFSYSSFFLVQGDKLLPVAPDLRSGLIDLITHVGTLSNLRQELAKTR